MPVFRRKSAPLQLAVHAMIFGASGLVASQALAEDASIERMEITGQALKYKTDSSSTATKTNTLLRDTPQAISVISEELVKDQSMQNMADVVRYVPGVQMAQGEGHRDAPILRGNSSTADFFINGIRDDVQYLRDLYNVRRVEVLKGPSGMIFGRGGSGGLINRVTKQADWSAGKSVDLTLGSYDQKRLTTDLNQVVSEQVAVRLTGMYEDAGSFRDYTELTRKAVNPTLSYQPNERTLVMVGYEHIEDDRTTDRGIPADMARQRPVTTSRSQFFGKPDDSFSSVSADGMHVSVIYELSTDVTLANHTRYADYDKLYRNVYASGYNPSTERVSLGGYQSGTQRQNLQNQTDLTWNFKTAGIQHTLLAGFEYNQQDTDNQRLTGYFPDGNTVAFSNPIYTGPVNFAQSATDADNTSDASTKAGYLQDQLTLSEQWQAIVGVRVDRFEVVLDNHRNGQQLSAVDTLVSPRVGLIYKPQEQVSAYVSVSQSYVPRAGEQLSSLTVANSSLDPEKFFNQELGLKWDISDAVSLTTAVYQLERTNVAVTDPSDSTKLVLVDGQVVKGLELEATGEVSANWSMVAGYAYQDSEVQNTANSAVGANSGNQLAQVPKHSVSFWNRYDISEQWGVGVGFTARSAVYTNTDNKVVLPGYGRVDVAAFYQPLESLKVQVNVENLLDKHYFASAHGNNNILPGSPTAVRLGVSYKF